jgi:hypothetical protein
MGHRRHLTTVTLCALLFLVIGTGNVVMGYRKGVYFDQAVQDLHRKRVEMGTFDTTLLERLQSKQSFYRIVSLGGIGLLCVAAILLGVDLVRHRRP